MVARAEQRDLLCTIPVRPPRESPGELEAQRDPCRLLTRLEAQRNPPDILVTNYSMLEYLLCRPQDAPPVRQCTANLSAR